MKSSSLLARSKLLSFLLRHKPEAAKLELDTQGWCTLQCLYANTDLVDAEVQEIVWSDTKMRYSFSADGLSIRANQGHSTSAVRLEFKTAVPPPALFHGTQTEVLALIMKSGLVPMNRHHVHLSHELETAQDVAGRRRGEIVILSVNTELMLVDGCQFYISENGVWLVDTVPAKYLTLSKDHYVYI